MDDDTSYCCKAMDDARAELASLRAQNELTHVAYVEENNRLMAEREALRDELAAANDRIEHMSKVLIDAEELLGVEETGELILRPIERLKAELSKMTAECERRFDGRANLLEVQLRLANELVERYSSAARQDAEEKARLTAEVEQRQLALECKNQEIARIKTSAAEFEESAAEFEQWAQETYDALHKQTTEEITRLREALEAVNAAGARIPHWVQDKVRAALACCPQEKPHGD